MSAIYVFKRPRYALHQARTISFDCIDPALAAAILKKGLHAYERPN